MGCFQSTMSSSAYALEQVRAHTRSTTRTHVCYTPPLAACDSWGSVCGARPDSHSQVLDPRLPKWLPRCVNSRTQSRVLACVQETLPRLSPPPLRCSIIGHCPD